MESLGQELPFVGKLEMMNLDEALDLMNLLRPSRDEFEAEIGRRDRSAYIRLSRLGVPERWAVVSTPGTSWFSLDVDGGFSTDYFEEEIPAEQARQKIELLVELAVEYLTTLPTARRRGVLGIPVILVGDPDKKIVLRKSFVGGVKHLLGMSPS